MSDSGTQVRDGMAELKKQRENTYEVLISEYMLRQ